MRKRLTNRRTILSHTILLISLWNVGRKRYFNEHRESLTTSQPDHNRFNLLSTVHYSIGVQALQRNALHN